MCMHVNVLFVIFVREINGQNPISCVFMRLKFVVYPNCLSDSALFCAQLKFSQSSQILKPHLYN